MQLEAYSKLEMKYDANAIPTVTNSFAGRKTEWGVSEEFLDTIGVDYNVEGVF